MPAVSIGMPVFNGERFLRVAVDSVLSQTFTDFELIICDNGSTDKTEHICREYEARDERVRYFRNSENIGAAGNFGRVFELSRAPYFRWLSVDDYCAPEILAKSTAVLDAYPEVVLCCSKVDIVDAEGTLVRAYADEQALLDESPATRFMQCLDQDTWCNAIYGLVRAEVLQRTGTLGAYAGSDCVLLARLSLYGRFWELPETLFFRRTHPEAFSHDCSDEKVKSFYAPERRRAVALNMWAWRHLGEHVKSALGASVTWRDRWRLAMYLMRKTWWQRRELLRELANAARYLFLGSSRSPG